MTRIPNPDLVVGPDNKQRWNRAGYRRHGFHNAHTLFRRALMLRAGKQFVLRKADCPRLADRPEFGILIGRKEFSALVCARGDEIILSRHAEDFDADKPHSIQSVTKLWMHLIAGRLIGEGRLDPGLNVEHYLPEIGSGYRGALVQDVLDMNVINDFVEDYANPLADSYAEEEALGWRLPVNGSDEITLKDFVSSITGHDLANRSMRINYCSANTDLLALICDRLVPGQLPNMMMDIADAAGFSGALHISLSPDLLPAFSGGGCLSAVDLARFGLLLLRVDSGDEAGPLSHEFTRDARLAAKKTLRPPRDFIHYAGQMMTNGRWIGHAGYGGQFLMADTKTGLCCAYLSVLENESGYCEDYMTETIRCLQVLTEQFESIC